MFKSRLPNLTVALTAALALYTSACTQPVGQLTNDSNPVNRQAQPFDTVTTATATAPNPATRPAPDSATLEKSAITPDAFQVAVERAASASRIGQSAQSRDDWRLVANRWQQAIALMKAIPASSSNRPQAQQKLAQYQQNLAYAQRQAQRPTAPINPNGVVRLSPIAPPPQSPQPVSSAPLAAAAPQASPPPDRLPSSTNRRFSAPIVRRAGNTPVIRVIFNDKQPFEMIVDTGASGTLITRQMASQLGVTTVAQANVDTASQRNVTFPLGYVQSIAVGGAVANQVLVAVAGPELDIGLLGHDFFGNYDVIIREREVEFQER